MTYDLGELSKIDDINIELAVKNYVRYEKYFDALDDFAKKATSYLSTYMPLVIVNSEEIRQDFLDELNEIQHTLINLGMFEFVSELTDLENFAIHGEVKMLEDGIRKFQANMDILTNKILSAGLDKQSESEQVPVILAVDDQAEILTSVSSMLEGRYKVIAVTSGADALKAMKMHHPTLFLLDIIMPEMDGLKLAYAIRKMRGHAKTPILFLTEDRQAKSVMTAKKVGACDYILKPVDKDILINKIESGLYLNWHL